MIDALVESGEIVILKAGGGRGRSAEYQLLRYVKGEHGSSFDAIKGEPETGNTGVRKGERGDVKGEPECIKGEQAVPPNRQEPSGTVKEPPPQRQLPTSDHHRLIDWWTRNYLSSIGSKYCFSPRDAAGAKKLLAHFDSAEAAKDFTAQCFSRRDSGFPFGSASTLYGIANNISPLQVALKSPAKLNGFHQSPAVVKPMRGPQTAEDNR